MPQAELKELLEAGVHFGHQTRRWNPRSKPYIFDHRQGVSIIDLEKTHKLLEGAAKFVEDAIVRNGSPDERIGVRHGAVILGCPPS